MDGDINNWVPPFAAMSLKIKANRNYYVETKFTGKHISDCVEALIAAYMLSGGVKHALKFVSKIGAVPLDKAGLLDAFPEDSQTIDIKRLETYNFKIDDNFKSIFKEY